MQNSSNKIKPILVIKLSKESVMFSGEELKKLHTKLNDYHVLVIRDGSVEMYLLDGNGGTIIYKTEEEVRKLLK